MGNRKASKPFSPHEAEKLRDLLAAPAETLPCPACGSALTLAPPADGVSSTGFWEIHCEHCGRGQILQDLV
jgi:hypothetical protein